MNSIFSVPVVLAATALVVSLGSILSEPALASPDSTSSLIAIGDVHGDFDDFVLILRRVGLIDAQQHWTGSATTLVQVGDVLDRGPREREVLDLLMELEPEARKAGGKIIFLLGNHEAMNIMGDLRYVTAAEYASFADGNSEKRRQSAYKQYVAWHKNHARLVAELPPGMLTQQSESDWMAHHPVGFIEQREAFAPGGQYGAWIRKHAVVVKIGESIFLHGGIHPRLSSMSLDEINTRVREEIHSFDDAKQSLVGSGLILPFFTLEEITTAARGRLILASKSATQDQRQTKLLELFLGTGGWLCVNSEGPLWFRGYAQWSDDEVAVAIDPLLKTYKAAHFVVGHTPQRTGRITPRLEGKILLIDTGMLRSYYPFGRPSALKIENGAKFVAEYLDSEEVLITSKALSQTWVPKQPTWDILAPTGTVTLSEKNGRTLLMCFDHPLGEGGRTGNQEKANSPHCSLTGKKFWSMRSKSSRKPAAVDLGPAVLRSPTANRCPLEVHSSWPRQNMPRLSRAKLGETEEANRPTQSALI